MTDRSTADSGGAPRWRHWLAEPPAVTWAPWLTSLGVRDQAQLVVLACESGLVHPGWLG